MAVDWHNWRKTGYRISPPIEERQPDDAWSAFRLCSLPWALDTECDIPFDPEILRRLESGDVAEAFRIASNRLRAHGIHMIVSLVLGDRARACLWASALAFPITRTTATRLLATVQPATSKEFKDVC
jgi:CRISPR-associated protein Csx17